MIADVAHQPGGLPLLQYALTELFERRDGDRLTLSAYREIGGVTGALSARADRLFSNADADGRRAIEQVFLRLVTLGEGRQDTRRRVAMGELDTLDVIRRRGGGGDRVVRSPPPPDLRPRALHPRADRGDRARGAAPRMGPARLVDRCRP